MPTPLSETVTTTSSRSRRAERTIVPPSGVYFAALLRRLLIDLGKSRKVGVEPERRVRQVEAEFVTPRVDQRVARVDCGLDDVA